MLTAILNLVLGWFCYTAIDNWNRDCEGGQALLIEEFPFDVYGREQQGKIKLNKPSALSQTQKNKYSISPFI